MKYIYFIYIEKYIVTVVAIVQLSTAYLVRQAKKTDWDQRKLTGLTDQEIRSRANYSHHRYNTYTYI